MHLVPADGWLFLECDSSRLMVQHGCKFDQDPSVLLHWRPRSELDFFVDLVQLPIPFRDAAAPAHHTVQEGRGHHRVTGGLRGSPLPPKDPRLFRTQSSFWPILNSVSVLWVQSVCCLAKPDHTYLFCGQMVCLLWVYLQESVDL